MVQPTFREDEFINNNVEYQDPSNPQERQDDPEIYQNSPAGVALDDIHSLLYPKLRPTPLDSSDEEIVQLQEDCDQNIYANKNSFAQQYIVIQKSIRDAIHDATGFQQYIEQVQMTTFDLTTFVTTKGHTLLTMAIKMNRPRAAKVLINCVREDKCNNQQIRRQDWINTPRRLVQNQTESQSFAQSGYTAIQYAVMIGDKELVDLLLLNGANPHYYDCRHHTMLHLAAKLDQPRMIFYISKVLGLDLDQPDLNGDTALHHAVRDGRVLSTIWLSSLGSDCNKFNREGKTPFHLALESAGKKEKEHTEVASKETIDMIVRALLIQGADKTLKDSNQHDGLDIANSKPKPWKKMLDALLKKQDERFAGNCCQRMAVRCENIMMLRRPLVPKERSPRLMIFYFIVMGLAWITLHSFVLPVITRNWPKWLVSWSFTLAIFFAALTAWTQPGWLGDNKAKQAWKAVTKLTHSEQEQLAKEEVRKNEHFMQLSNDLQTLDLCPECRTIKIPRSQHCSVCGICVDRFDHHCPWLNTCIGRRNQTQFLIFVCSQYVFIIAVIMNILVFYFENISKVQDRLDVLPYLGNPVIYEGVCGSWDWCFVTRNISRHTTLVLAHSFAGFWLIWAGVFERIVFNLLQMQIGNFSQGKTSFERMQELSEKQGTQPEVYDSISLPANLSDIEAYHYKKLNTTRKLVYQRFLGHGKDKNCISNCLSMCTQSCGGNGFSEKDIISDIRYLMQQQDSENRKDQ